MADVVFDNFKKNIMNGNIDLDTNTIKVALVTSSYTPTQATHEFFNQVTNEVSGTGYTAGGATLASAAVSASEGKGVFDANDVTWANSTITARGAVIYKDTGASTTSPIIAYIDFGSDKVSSGGDFKITWNASGILTLT
jgi:hypothetical protein